VTNLGELSEIGATRLAAAGLEQPRREARLLLAAAAGIEASAILAWPERPVAPPAIERYTAHLDRRVAREPLSRILGHREFWSLDFIITDAVLDPRPDTETLIEAVMAALADRSTPRRVLDCGTGSGCILLALLHEWPTAQGIGLDRSEAAIQVAQMNADRLGLKARARFLVGDWVTAIGAAFDVIVSNPPYIPRGDIPGLAPEVSRFDPSPALDGGADGLDPYRVLIPAASRLLVPGGILAVEVGHDQAAVVEALFEAAGFADHETRPDLAGIPRVVIGRRPSATK